MRGERRLIVTIAALAALDLVAWFAAFPLLPYWSKVAGLSGTQSGVLVAAYGISVLTVSIPAGRLADRIGPKRVTVSAALVFAACVPLLAHAETFATLLTLRLLQGVFSGVSWSAGLAWLAASLPSERRSGAIATVNGVGTGASLLGPLIGGPAVELFGLRPVMYSFGAIVLVTCLSAASLPDSGSADVERAPVLATIINGSRDPLLRSSFIGMAFISSSLGVVQFAGPLHLSDHGVSPSAVGVVLSAGAIGSIGVIGFIGRYGEKLGHVVIMRSGMALVAAAGVGLSLIGAIEGHAALLVFAMACSSFVFATSYPVCAAGAESAGIGQGIAMGVLNTIWAAGSIVAPVAAGVLRDVGGEFLAYSAIAVFAFVAATLVQGAPRSHVAESAAAGSSAF